MVNDRVPPRRKRLGIAKPHAALIDGLGGPTVVAGLLKTKYQVEVRALSVAMWRQRSVPHRFRHAISGIAREQGKSDLLPPRFTLGG